MTKDSGIFAVSYTSILTPTQVLAPVQVSVLTLGLPDRYTDKNLQKETKLALKLFVWARSKASFKQTLHFRNGP